MRKNENCREVVRDIDIVFNLAGRIGGIEFNKQMPGELFYDNLMMGTNLMEEARKNNVEKFISLGTMCSYPKFTPQPITEDDIWNGYPEEVTAAYGLAKKMQIVQSLAYKEQYDFNSITVFVTNLYGPNDNFDLQSSHVLPALIRKFHEAKENKTEFVEVWGSGKPKREFLYVDDLADACVYLLKYLDAETLYDKMKISHINIGYGEDLFIVELAEIIRSIVDFQGEIRYDSTKPDGTPRKLLDITRIKQLGWKPTITLQEGIKKSYEWYLENHCSVVN